MKRRLLAAAPALLLGCAAAFAPARPAWPALPDGHFMSVGDFLQVTGTGRPSRAARSETQGRSEARDAALLDAWTRLRSYIDSLPLEGGGSAYGATRNDATLAKAVEKLIYTAEIVDTRYDGPVAAVVVRVDKGRINRLLGTDFR